MLLNHALRDIPADRCRYHVCWGSWNGPHINDVPLQDIADLILRVNVSGYSLEGQRSRASRSPRRASERSADGLAAAPRCQSRLSAQCKESAREIARIAFQRKAEIVGFVERRMAPGACREGAAAAPDGHECLFEDARIALGRKTQIVRVLPSSARFVSHGTQPPAGE